VLAHHVGVEFDVLADWDAEVCPAWTTPPTIPAHGEPFEIDDVDGDWIVEYHRGLAATLDAARGPMRTAPIIVEAHDKKGREFGTDRLVRLVRKHRDKSSQEISRLVLNATSEWSRGVDMDDRTIVIVKATGDQARPKPAFGSGA